MFRSAPWLLLFVTRGGWRKKDIPIPGKFLPHKLEGGYVVLCGLLGRDMIKHTHFLTHAFVQPRACGLHPSSPGTITLRDLCVIHVTCSFNSLQAHTHTQTL